MRNQADRPGGLLDSVRRRARVHCKSIRTEKAYLRWIREHLQFHRDLNSKWVHPSEMDGSHASEFLEYLAAEKIVAKGTKNQALPVLLFLK